MGVGYRQYFQLEFQSRWISFNSESVRFFSGEAQSNNNGDTYIEENDVMFDSSWIVFVRHFNSQCVFLKEEVKKGSSSG